MARSKQIDGPYEIHPENPLLTAWQAPEAPLQNTGHGMFVEAADGSWWTTHLCGRPLANGRSILGRESGIQPIVWGEDGCSRACDTVAIVRHYVLKVQIFLRFLTQRRSQSTRLQMVNYRTCSNRRVGLLMMSGSTYRSPGVSPSLWWRLVSRFRQSHIARRIQHFDFRVEATVEIDPVDWQHAGGLTAYYNRNWYWLRITTGDHGPIIGLEWMDDANYGWVEEQLSWLAGPIELCFEMHDEALRASWRQGRCWRMAAFAWHLRRNSPKR